MIPKFQGFSSQCVLRPNNHQRMDYCLASTLGIASIQMVLATIGYNIRVARRKKANLSICNYRTLEMMRTFPSAGLHSSQDVFSILLLGPQHMLSLLPISGSEPRVDYDGRASLRCKKCSAKTAEQGFDMSPNLRSSSCQTDLDHFRPKHFDKLSLKHSVPEVRMADAVDGKPRPKCHHCYYLQLFLCA
jgi:hypothetical protein